MKPIRSFLFVPAHKEKWVARIADFGADAVILDLEDSVPVDLKPAARAIAGDAIGELAAAGQRVYVRVNPTPYISDLGSACRDQEQLRVWYCPRPAGPRVSHPRRAGVRYRAARRPRRRAHRFLPVLSPRVRTVFSDRRTSTRGHAVRGSARNGDVARAMGFEWTEAGLGSPLPPECAVLAVRAAGKSCPIAGLWQDVHDLDGLRRYCEFHRQLGFKGEMILHPSNVAVANAVFTPGEAELDYYRGMIEAFETAERGGRAAIVYEGEHVDYAHVATAREVLAMARDLGA